MRNCLVTYPAILLTVFAFTSAAGETQPARPARISLQADSHLAAADSLQQIGQFDKAFAHCGKALTRYRQILDRTNEAKTLHLRGQIYYEQEAYFSALADWQEALEIYRQMGDRQAEGVIWKNLGWVYDDLADYPQALACYQQSLRMSREFQDRTLEAQILNNLGVVYFNMSDFPTAIRYHQESLETRRELGDRQGEAATLNNLGMVYDVLSQHTEALSCYQESLELFRRLKDRGGEARVLGNMGVVYKALSNYARALDYYQRSLAIKKELDNRRGEAITLSNIGVIYDLLFDPRKALEFYQKSLDISRELGDRMGEGETLVNMGLAHEALADYTEALNCFRESLLIRRQLSDRRGEGLVLNDLGIIYEDLGDYARALDYYQQDLKICKKLQDQSGECISLANIGMLYSQQGKHTEALQNLQQAISLAQRTQNAADVQLTRIALARCYDAQGQFSQAVESYQLAIKSLESVRGKLLVEAQKSSFAAGTADIYAALILALAKLGREAEALNYSERARARAFLDMLASGEVKVGKSKDYAFLKEEQELEAQAENLQEQLIESAADSGEALTLRGQLNSLADRLQIKKQEEPELTSLVSVNALNLPEVQVLLGPEDTLLEYYLTEEKTLIWCVTRDQAQLFQFAVGKDSLQMLVRGWRDALASAGAVEARSKALYDLLIAPLEGSLSTRNLLIVPHLSLHYLSFAALQSAKGDYLLDHYTISYLPSASVLKYLGAKKGHGEQRMLAFGNPQTDRKDFSPLPFAEQEVQNISGLMDESRVYVGASASEANFLIQSPNYDLLHLACHSELNSAYPLYSGLLLAPGEGQDGDLTVHELFALDLNADLVVLSGCQTGLGSLTNGDEIVGISRAFIYAGTPAVIASLWRIEDKSTAFLMQRFYVHLKNFNRAEALRRAQMDARKLYDRPYFWAPFILIGAGEEKL